MAIKGDKYLAVRAFYQIGASYLNASSLKFYKKIIKYILVGLSAITIDLIVMISLVELLIWQAPLAASAGFVLSASSSFFLHKFWTFRDRSRDYWRQYSQFVLTALVGLVINYYLMTWLISIGLHYISSRLIAIVIIFFWNFFINSWWAFKPTNKDLSTSGR